MRLGGFVKVWGGILGGLFGARVVLDGCFGGLLLGRCGGGVWLG